MLTIIVPVAPKESALDDFLAELTKLPGSFEILLVSTDVQDRPESECWRWLQASKPGRAAALNAGAKQASNEWLWFVHADSRGLAQAAAVLQEKIRDAGQVMMYFDLCYYDGYWIHKLSEWGAKMRSRWLGAPFGDQAFCLRRELHDKIGGYREDAVYGEDHLYARALRAAKVPLIPVNKSIGTSARMHLENGWLKVVCKYQWMWIKQALQDRKVAS